MLRQPQDGGNRKGRCNRPGREPMRFDNNVASGDTPHFCNALDPGKQQPFRKTETIRTTAADRKGYGAQAAHSGR